MTDKLQVLIVEDDPDVRLGCTQALELEDIPVMAVDNAELACRRIARDFAGVIVSDIRLPGMVYGAVVRPRTIGGRILGIDASACKLVPGFLGLYRDGDFAGLIASRRGTLAQAMSVRIA